MKLAALLPNGSDAPDSAWAALSFPGCMRTASVAMHMICLASEQASALHSIPETSEHAMLSRVQLQWLNRLQLGAVYLLPRLSTACARAAPRFRVAACAAHARSAAAPQHRCWQTQVPAAPAREVSCLCVNQRVVTFLKKEAFMPS
eukprot:6202795-Pleurochrysis_carterae.AAC.3